MQLFSIVALLALAMYLAARWQGASAENQKLRRQVDLLKRRLASR
jgi:hypothetical protein